MKEDVLKKIDLLLADIKKDMAHEKETNKTWFNNELMALRIKEIREMVEHGSD